ncbi:MAG: hypothetical protein RR327_04185 [Clostridia bacterium]
MNYYELKQLWLQATSLGMRTVADLRKFMQEYQIKDKNELINKLNCVFVLEV